MKRKSMLALWAILTICFSVTASAQERLDAVMKKCESMDDVSMNVVQQKNPKTKKLTKVIKSINIKNDKALVDEFLNAFKAEKDNATQTIDKKREGKLMPSYYQFHTEGKKVSYSISVKNNGADASVSMIQDGE